MGSLKATWRLEMQHVIPECYKEPNVIREQSWRLPCSTVSLMTPPILLALTPSLCPWHLSSCFLLLFSYSHSDTLKHCHMPFALKVQCIEGHVIGFALELYENLLHRAALLQLKWTGSEGKFVRDVAKHLDSFRAREADRKVGIKKDEKE